MTALDVLERRYFPPPGTPDAAPVSRRGTVRPLVDGVEYFDALRREIDALRPGDRWYLTGWLFAPGFRFGVGGPTVETLLVSAAAAGIDVRVLLWASRLLLSGPADGPLAAYRRVTELNVRAAERLRSLTVPSGAAPLSGRVLLDWSGNAASSHHMKLAVLVRGGQVTAFAGGLDLWPDRYDSAPHTSMPVLGVDGRPLPWGWHDAGVVVTGEPARRVLGTVETRWAEASTLSPATYDVGDGQRPYNPPPLAPPLAPLPPPALPAADARTGVQVVRSWPAAKEFRGVLRTSLPWRTLPAGGVHEILRTLTTAIGAARRYVYVEDQAFDAEGTLFPLLAGACRRGVKVIALLPGWVDPNDGGNAPLNAVLSPAVRRGLLDPLPPAQQQNLAVWRLNGVTVHSKVVLIDDEFLCVGSANAMDRSLQDTMLGDDSELSVAAVSTGSLVADLRVRLWAEHLRVTGAAALAEIRDLDRSLGVWRPAWGGGLTVPHPASPLALIGPAVAVPTARSPSRGS